MIETYIFMYGMLFLTNFSFTDISSIKSPSLSVTMATSYIVIPSVEEHLNAMLRSKVVSFVLEPVRGVGDEASPYCISEG